MSGAIMRMQRTSPANLAALFGRFRIGNALSNLACRRRSNPLPEYDVVRVILARSIFLLL